MFGSKSLFVILFALLGSTADAALRKRNVVAEQDNHEDKTVKRKLGNNQNKNLFKEDTGFWNRFVTETSASFVCINDGGMLDCGDKCCEDGACIDCIPVCVEDGGDVDCGSDCCEYGACVPCPQVCPGEDGGQEMDCGDDCCVDDKCVPCPMKCPGESGPGEEMDCGDDCCEDSECVPCPPPICPGEDGPGEEMDCGDDCCEDSECVPCPMKCPGDFGPGEEMDCGDLCCEDAECVPCPAPCPADGGDIDCGDLCCEDAQCVPCPACPADGGNIDCGDLCCEDAECVPCPACPAEGGMIDCGDLCCEDAQCVPCPACPADGGNIDCGDLCCENAECVPCPACPADGGDIDCGDLCCENAECVPCPACVEDGGMIDCGDLCCEDATCVACPACPADGGDIDCGSDCCEDGACIPCPPCELALNIDCPDCFAVIDQVQNCEDRPLEITMLYAGGSCNMSRNCQDDKFECTDYRGGPPHEYGTLSWIRAMDDDEETLFFEGWVPVGELYLMENNMERFPADQRIWVYSDIPNATASGEDDGSNLLQMLQYHSSCSQNLDLLNRFGSQVIAGFYNEEQGNITGFNNATFGVTVDIPVDAVVFEGEAASVTSLVILQSSTAAENEVQYPAQAFNVTDAVLGTAVGPGDTFETSVAIPINLAVEQNYTFLISMTAETASGVECTALELIQFTAGGSPLDIGSTNDCPEDDRRK